MSYSYDQWGWLSATRIIGRETDVAPPAYDTQGPLRPNWTGFAWQLLTYVAPVIIPEVVPRPTITKKAFLRLFTAAEREAIANIRAVGTQVQKNKINAFFDYVDGGVELDDPHVITVVNLMETAGVIAAGRAAQILA